MITAREIADDVQQTFNDVSNSYRNLLETRIEQYAQHVCKDKKNNIEERTEILDAYPFERFWALYDKKVGKKSKIESKWNKLSEKVRKEIIEYIPYYRQSQPNKQYRKNPETFLNNEGWKDEIIKDNNGTTYTDKISEYLSR